eukprot:comp23728_c0_seq1/m.40907 comp23728_c0_seq1/g.40907  ORF comp23728_c0_seq1/g.40907 comp23728_c0_seq1/m.40907 type:complete len:839 (-) comp23728_c0_seq1:238-2754(-)
MEVLDVGCDLDLLAALEQLDSTSMDTGEDGTEMCVEQTTGGEEKEVEDADDPELLQAAIKELQMKLKQAELKKAKTTQSSDTPTPNEPAPTGFLADGPPPAPAKPQQPVRIESHTKGEERKSYMTPEQEEAYREQMRKVQLGLVQAGGGTYEHEKFSRIAIRDRTVDAKWLEEKLNGRKFIKLSQLEKELKGRGDVQGDWITVGAIGAKQTCVSSKGAPFTKCTLLDLGNTSVQLYLFKDAHNQLESLEDGSLVALLNLEILPPKEGHSNAFAVCLSAPQQLMKLGTAAHYGVCKSVRKDGKVCNSPINLSQGKACSYHVVKELGKAQMKRHVINAGASRGVTIKGQANNLSRDGVFLLQSKYGPQGAQAPTAKPLAPNQYTSQQPRRSANQKDSLDKENVDPNTGGNVQAKPQVTIVRGSADVLKVLTTSRFGAKQFREENKNVPAARVPKTSSTALIKKFGVDPVTNKTERQIMAEKRMATSASVMDVLNQPTRVQKKPMVLSANDIYLPPPKKTVMGATITFENDNKPDTSKQELLALLRSGQIKLDKPDPNAILKAPQKKRPLENEKDSEGRKRVREEGGEGDDGKEMRAGGLKERPNGVSAATKQRPNYKNADRPKPKRPRPELAGGEGEIIGVTNNSRVEVGGKQRKPRTPEEEAKMRKREEKRGEKEEKERQEAERRANDPLYFDENLEAALMMRAQQLENALDPEVEHFLKEMEASINKDAMEMKAIDVKELEVLVVTCKQCKYTMQGASTFCTKNHPGSLDRHKATKKWYECERCTTRHATFTGRPPNKPCRQCQGVKYVQAGMKKDNIQKTDKVLARGEEQPKFLRAY